MLFSRRTLNFELNDIINRMILTFSAEHAGNEGELAYEGGTTATAVRASWQKFLQC